jgi:hypothetical protein
MAGRADLYLVIISPYPAHVVLAVVTTSSMLVVVAVVAVLRGLIIKQ